MLDFSLVHDGQFTVKELVEREGVTFEQLPSLTNEMIDRMLALIADCADGDVPFVPDDPDAEDTFADNADIVNLAWTLGHVIVHTTASAEESAFLAAELARGVEMRAGRSRNEVPWQTVRRFRLNRNCERRRAQNVGYRYLAFIPLALEFRLNVQ
jgi:hypothetical protein